MTTPPLTEQEAAQILGITPRSVRRRADEFVTTPAPAASANGRAPRLYDLASMPPDAGLRWAEGQKVINIQTTAPGQMALPLTVPQGPNLSPEDREEAERRYRVIEPLVTPLKFVPEWTLAHNRKGELIAMLAGQWKTKPRTIYHWLQAFKTGGLPALVTRDRADKGQPRALNAAALEFLVAAAAPRKGAYGELTIAEIFRAYKEERAWRASHAKRPLGEFELRKYARYLDGGGRLKPEAQLPEASYRTFCAWFDRIPEAYRVYAREGLEAFSNTQEVISFRDFASIKPLDYVVMDHRRLDLFCMVQEKGTQKLIRPWLTAAIDMRTRRWLAWVIVETPSSDSIASVLKRAFLDHGLPGALYWDNGKDFRCEWLEGRAHKGGETYRVGEMAPGMRGVLETLGVRVHHAIVRRARSKIIEPNFVRTAEYDKSTPWWCGHKTTARPERFDELVKQHEKWLKGEAAEAPFPTIERVAWLYDELLKTLNERDLRGEGMQKVTPTGRGWMCPNECWEKLIGQVELRTAPPDVMQFCFARRKQITVRHGEIRVTFGGRQYHYRPLGGGSLIALDGREVECAYDPHDLGTAAVYHESRFVGLVQDVELRHMGEDDFVQDERDRRADRRDTRKMIEDVHKAVYVPGTEERAMRRAAVRPDRVEPFRPELPAELPAAAVAAAAAAAADKGFRFAASDGAEIIRQADAAAYRDDDPDDEFDFFGGTK